MQQAGKLFFIKIDELNTMQTVIIIPAYNEEERMPLHDIKSFVNESDDSIRIVLVDDGSKDATRAVIEKLAAEYPGRIMALSLAKNGGKAEAIRQGMLYAISNLDFDYACYLDADLSAPLHTAGDLVSEARKYNSPALVFGSRVDLHGSTRIIRNPKRHWVGRIVATMISEILKIPVYDTQCGAKLVARDYIELLYRAPFYSRWFFDVEMILRLRASSIDMSKQLIEVPIRQWEEKGGSHLSFLDGISIPFKLFELKRKYKSSF